MKEHSAPYQKLLIRLTPKQQQGADEIHWLHFLPDDTPRRSVFDGYYWPETGWLVIDNVRIHYPSFTVETKPINTSKPRST